MQHKLNQLFDTYTTENYLQMYEKCTIHSDDHA